MKNIVTKRQAHHHVVKVNSTSFSKILFQVDNTFEIKVISINRSECFIHHDYEDQNFTALLGLNQHFCFHYDNGIVKFIFSAFYVTVKLNQQNASNDGKDRIAPIIFRLPNVLQNLSTG